MLFPIAGMGSVERASVAPSPARQVTVLVVEDDDAVRALTSRVLRDAGFRVLEASSGDAAVAHMGEQGRDIAVVVSDVTMPGMDGVQTLHALRALRNDLPCLFVTGYAYEEARLRAIDHVTVLGKPFVPASLVAGVHAMLTR